MPLWFKALPAGRKALVVLGAIVALIAAVTALVLAVNAHDRAVKQSGRDEVQAQWNAEKAERQRIHAEFAEELGNALDQRFATLGTRIDGIDTAAARISVEMPKAIATEPRYRDPNCNLTPPVLDQANAARALSQPGAVK